MFDKFTDRARKVMALANQEAQRFNHEYIGSEHMLLGIIKEGSGVASDLLSAVTDIRVIRLEVEKLVKSGPDMVTMGKLPMTPRAKAAIDYAFKFARECGNDYIGTEHLLYGILVDAGSVAYAALLNAEVEICSLKAQLESYCKKSEVPPTTYNAGIECDMRSGGPCACGAWHDKPKSNFSTKEVFHELVMSLANSRDYELLSKILLLRNEWK
jgi:ATP-dependent Clp protease ATP-binding subunit ClpA